MRIVKGVFGNGIGVTVMRGSAAHLIQSLQAKSKAAIAATSMQKAPHIIFLLTVSQQHAHDR
jgi:hypothetical protein